MTVVTTPAYSYYMRNWSDTSRRDFDTAASDQQLGLFAVDSQGYTGADLFSEQEEAGVPKMQATPIAKSSLRLGHRTCLGIITKIEMSKSGKTMTITVDRGNGSLFTDRVSAIGNMYVFTNA